MFITQSFYHILVSKSKSFYDYYYMYMTKKIFCCVIPVNTIQNHEMIIHLFEVFIKGT